MMKTQYIKPEIQMVLLEKKLMASNSISWTVDNSNKENDPFSRLCTSNNTLCSYGKLDCYVNQSVLKVSDDNLLI